MFKNMWCGLKSSNEWHWNNHVNYLQFITINKKVKNEDEFNSVAERFSVWSEQPLNGNLIREGTRLTKFRSNRRTELTCKWNLSIIVFVLSSFSEGFTRGEEAPSYLSCRANPWYSSLRHWVSCTGAGGWSETTMGAMESYGQGEI